MISHHTPTPRQMDLLRYIAGYIDAHDGVSPTFAEMQATMGFASKSPVHHVLKRLEQRGHIRRIPNRARAIELLHAPTIPRGFRGEPLYFISPLRLKTPQSAGVTRPTRHPGAPCFQAAHIAKPAHSPPV